MKDNCKLEKKEMRTQMVAARRRLDKAYIEISDQGICANLLALPEYRQAETVFCFVSMTDEIDTFPILRAVLESGKRLAVPKCLERGHMEAYEIVSLDELQPGYGGILEPVERCRQIPREAVGLAVVPCLTCDGTGIRLGYGGGYYDRYLSARHYPAAVICREKQLSAKVPCDPWDQAMDLIVTEQRVMRL